MLTPVIIGFGIGYTALGGFLAAVILVGQLMANYLSNAGGAWDNAKKYIEDGHHGGKGSDAHMAAVIGDTVGDPFKDTAGPALNPLIKVMNLVSLLILPAIISLSTIERGQHPQLDARDRRLRRRRASPSSCCSVAIAFSKREGAGIADAGSGDAPAARRTARGRPRSPRPRPRRSADGRQPRPDIVLRERGLGPRSRRVRRGDADVRSRFVHPRSLCGTMRRVIGRYKGMTPCAHAQDH